ncbi:MAG: thiamine phosphate synthase [Armatimonadota bacterium]|nr:thiamine phosphate synthase [Armatimonadota bacterium]MDR7450528.1 thiamine phosphate synthase [Armatimonadota bacterium]MDR7466339.1 thiamine phosphate synthase [Armatimonadota bacterium]MDR7493060.1 thiamine phosphate synthase [Armatimonadota bacterium]MDR7498183.1 thiamine phosphate synthase [Armatimonadota bacterium]
MRRVDYSVYVITDRSIGGGRSHEEMVAAAIAGGATIVQVREKRLPTRAFVEAVARARAVAVAAGIPLIVNDRVDVALAVDADGVHVGPDDLPVAVARRLLGRHKIVGASAGTVEEAVAAERDGATYLGVGSVFATSSKPDAGAPIGVAALQEIVRAVRIPVVGIGGITAANASRVIAAGASGVAVISSVVGADDITAATRRLVEVVRAARHATASG